MRKLLIVLGVPVDNLTMTEALERCDEFVAAGRASGRTHQIATVNADFVVNSLHDPELRRILQEADMATADGMPLVWASRLLGGPVPGRVTGADMVPALAERAAERGYSIFFLGAREGIAAQAAAILQQRHPALKVAGVLSPKPASVLEMDREVVDAVIAAKPDILLVAFGNPKQEKWIKMHAHELQIPICIGIGGTLDMIVGVTKRAPRWMQRFGMEWLYRLAQEPKRLFKRYLHDFGYFGYFFAHQWWAMRRGTAIDMAPAPLPPAAPEMPQIALSALSAPSTPDQTIAVLTLHGRLDVSNQEHFTLAANRALDNDPYLVIDLTNTTFLDSSALGALVALTNRARAAGGEIWLSAVQQPILDILRLVRLDNFFEFVPDTAAAESRRNTPQAAATPEPIGDWSVLRSPRMFDTGTAPDLIERSIEALEDKPQLVLDLSETIFLASAGLAALIKIDRSARERGGALRIAGCSHDVLRTIKLVKLDGMLSIHPDVASAISTAPASGVAKWHPAPIGGSFQ